MSHITAYTISDIIWQASNKPDLLLLLFQNHVVNTRHHSTQTIKHIYERSTEIKCSVAKKTIDIYEMAKVFF